MNTHPLLENLNEKQAEAVGAPLSNSLILAGAGSGKTRVLVHRIGYLMQEYHASPFSIMAVTFTNKAASEMRERIEGLGQFSSRGIWCGTFHGLCHRILRSHYLEAKLPQDFQIIDSDDQLRLIKRVISNLNLDEKLWPAKQASWWISAQKDDGLRVKDIDTFDQNQRQWAQIYQEYQTYCDRSGLVDFAEIILRTCELLQENQAIRDHYQNRFSNILVDEFQDTNNIQYTWLKLMSGQASHVMVVGDDDQSIYGWRGAKIENIQRFLNEYKNSVTIRLEQNYRSTSQILKCANHLIANNEERMGKELWTQAEDGEPISIYNAYNELDEAKFVQDKIKQWQQAGNNLKDVAVLYRSNAQSRVIEEAMLQGGLPYRIYGGMRFFERQEIKDALSYLRLMNYQYDDSAFERVVNRPTRGIGDKTIDLLRQTARHRGCTLWEASEALIGEQVLTKRASNALHAFMCLILDLKGETKESALFEMADQVIHKTGLIEMYRQEKGEKGKARIENLEELISATRQFKPEEALDPEEENQETLSPLSAFLAQVSLEAGERQAGEFDDAVQMMTLHSAKGLEFRLVFMVGVEEGMFPSARTVEEDGRVEEERRLCYVGMTRAMDKLYISHADARRLYGQDKIHRASRFIDELPQDDLDFIRPKSTFNQSHFNQSYGNFDSFDQSSNYKKTASTPQTKSAKSITRQTPDHGFNMGMKIKHSKFGLGTIINLDGEHKVQIAFNHEGIKWLDLNYAKLERV